MSPLEPAWLGRLARERTDPPASTARLGRHPDKLQTFRALLQLAATFDAKLVAEGIEQAADLHVLRDLGVHLGQGWLLGRPAAEPVAQMAEAARAVVASDELSVLPEPRWGRRHVQAGGHRLGRGGGQAARQAPWRGAVRGARRPAAHERDGRALRAP